MSQSTMAIIVLIITIAIFVSQKVAMPVAALIGGLLMVIIGALTPANFCSYFGNNVCLLLAGVAVVSAAMFETGLSAKIGAAIIKVKVLTSTEKAFLLGIMVVSGVMSIFVANVPVVALFMPIIATVAASSQGRITKKHLYYPMGCTVSVCGAGSLVGSATNLLGSAALEETVGFGMEMFAMLPVVLILMAVTVLYFFLFGYQLQQKVFDFPEAKDDNENAGEEQEYRPLQAWIAGLTFVGIMIMFIRGVWNFGAVACLGAVICVLAGCISWKKAVQKIDWNTIITIAGALALAGGFSNSGAGDVVANAVVNMFGGESASPVLIMCVAIVLTSAVGCFMSHNAMVAVLVPIFCTVATKLGSDPLAFAVAVTVAINICHATPVSTTIYMMPLSAGYRFNDFVKVGLPILIISDIVMCIIMPVLYHL